MSNISKLKRIEDILSSLKIDMAGPVTVDYENGENFIIFLSGRINDKGVRIPGRSQIKTIQALLNMEGYNVSLILVDDNSKNIDATIKSFLFNSFEKVVRNSFSIEDEEYIDIWIDPKTILEEEKYDAIANATNGFVRAFSRKEVRISFTKKQNTPTMSVIIRVIRLGAPISLNQISTRLLEKGFDVPNEVWLAHALDKIRKAGNISWRMPGTYFLTLQGLNMLGSEKNKRSPDISRALELARRKS